MHHLGFLKICFLCIENIKTTKNQEMVKQQQKKKCV